MKKSRYPWAALAAVALTMSLTACGGGGDSEKAAASSPSSTETSRSATDSGFSDPDKGFDCAGLVNSGALVPIIGTKHSDEVTPNSVRLCNEGTGVGSEGSVRVEIQYAPLYDGPEQFKASGFLRDGGTEFTPKGMWKLAMSGVNGDRFNNMDDATTVFLATEIADGGHFVCTSMWLDATYGPAVAKEKQALAIKGCTDAYKYLGGDNS